MQNGMKKSEINGGLLFLFICLYFFCFIGRFVGLLVCWFLVASFGEGGGGGREEEQEEEQEEEEEEEEKQKKNGTVNCNALTCLVFLIITVKNVKYLYLCKIFIVLLVV